RQARQAVQARYAPPASTATAQTPETAETPTRFRESRFAAVPLHGSRLGRRPPPQLLRAAHQIQRPLCRSPADARASRTGSDQAQAPLVAAAPCALPPIRSHRDTPRARARVRRGPAHQPRWAALHAAAAEAVRVPCARSAAVPTGAAPLRARRRVSSPSVREKTPFRAHFAIPRSSAGQEAQAAREIRARLQ